MVGVGDLLPREIWSEILTRLPVKMVLRCRSVCKSWYSLSSCPNFISDHSTRNLNKNENRVLLHVRDVSGCWSYRSLDGSSMESRVHDDDDIPDLEIVGSCNGLICLSNTSDGIICSSSYKSRPRIKFIIWNPSIGKIVKVPSRPFRPHTQRLSYFGFGFDSKTNDYRVLCVVGNRDRNTGDISDAMCEIFDLKTGVWRVICPRAPSSWCLGGGNIAECYLDGAVHWSGRRVLLSFSLSDESFREIKMPDLEGYAGDSPTIRSVTFGGLIYVIVWMVMDNRACMVWAMEEYGVTESWTRVFNVNLQSCGAVLSHTICKSPRFFRLWRNGEVLLVQARLEMDRERDMYIEDKQDLVSYNPENKKFERLLSYKTISDLCLYEESLVLM